MAYGRALGIIMVSISTLFFAMYMTMSVLSSVWLSVWSQDQLLANDSIPITSPVYVQRRDLYLGIYGGMGLLQGKSLFVVSSHYMIIIGD